MWLIKVIESVETTTTTQASPFWVPLIVLISLTASATNLSQENETPLSLQYFYIMKKKI